MDFIFKFSVCVKNISNSKRTTELFFSWLIFAWSCNQSILEHYFDPIFRCQQKCDKIKVPEFIEISRLLIWKHSKTFRAAKMTKKKQGNEPSQKLEKSNLGKSMKSKVILSYFIRQLFHRCWRAGHIWASLEVRTRSCYGCRCH